MNLKENVLYKTTCDNKTYKLKRWANEGLCCMRCINRGRRTWYFIHNWGKTEQRKNPNWKLVSKSKKQWMKKPLKIKVIARHNTTYAEFKW